MDPISQNQDLSIALPPPSMAQITFSRPSSSHSTLSTISDVSTTSLGSITSQAPKWNIHKPQFDANGRRLDAMSREYALSGKELSVEEMLALPPLPRSFKHEIAKKDAEKVRLDDAEKRKMDLEAAKKKLRALALR